MEGTPWAEKNELMDLLPKVVAWAEEQTERIARDGAPLNEVEVGLAKRGGVEHPERVRVLEVDSIPEPEDEELAQAAAKIGFEFANMAGLTLMYGIYIEKERRSPRLISHELRHVYQYEQADSLRAFLTEYLTQLSKHGYEDAPLEIDARQHEYAESDANKK